MRRASWPLILIAALLAAAVLLAMLNRPAASPPPVPTISRYSTVPQPTHPLTDAEYCAMVRRASADMLAAGPRMVGPVTRVDRVAVDCASRTVTAHKTLLFDRATRPRNWRRNAQRELDGLTCGNRHNWEATRRGWRLVTHIAFQSGGALETFLADCRGPWRPDLAPAGY